MIDFDFNKFEAIARHASYLTIENLTPRERHIFLSGAYWAYEHFRREQTAILKQEQLNDLYLANDIREALNGSN